LIWWALLSALSFATVLSLIEVLIRYRDYPLGSHLRSRSTWLLLITYGLASGVTAALVVVLLYTEKLVPKIDSANELNVVIVSTLSAFAVLRMGLATAKSEKTLASSDTLKGGNDAIGVMRSALSFLLLKIDQSTQACYVAYVYRTAREILAKTSISYGSDHGRVISACAQVAGLTSPTSFLGSPAMDAFRMDIDRLQGEGFDDDEKTRLMMRYCIHHVGKKYVLLAIEDMTGNR
jgi:hypothetical protein